MDDTEELKYEAKRRELEKQISAQEKEVFRAQLLVNLEVRKLQELQHRLSYLHLE